VARSAGGGWRFCDGARLASVAGPRRRNAVKRLRRSYAWLRRLRRDCVSSARLFASMSLWCAMRPTRPLSLTKETWRPNASPRGAVKVREAGECSCIRLGEATAEGGLTFTASTTMAARRLAFWRRGGTAWVAGTSPAMTAGTPMASRQARSFARHINACTYRHMTFPRNVPPSPCFLRDFRGDPPPFSRGNARFRARGRSTRRHLRSFSGPHDGLRRHDGRRSGKSVGPPNNFFLKDGIYGSNRHLKSRTKVLP